VGVVTLDEPWPAYYGGVVAAPAFAAIARQVLLYWGVPPQPGLPPLPGAAPGPQLIPPAEPPSFGMPTVQLAGAPPLVVAPPPAGSLPGLDLGEGDGLDGPALVELNDDAKGAAAGNVPAGAVPVPATAGVLVTVPAGTGGGAH